MDFACNGSAELNCYTKGAEFLTRNGYHAQANTTKVVKANEDWRTPLPHKTVATRAGLGWIGKNCLLVTREYGSAVRLSSLLTDAPLPSDVPVTESYCGNCTVCVSRCPAKALTGTLWTPETGREQLPQNKKRTAETVLPLPVAGPRRPEVI